jgi:hypothetical protein
MIQPFYYKIFTQEKWKHMSKQIYTQMFIAAWLVIVLNWIQLKCSSTGTFTEWNLLINKDELFIHVIVGMNFKVIILSLRVRKKQLYISFSVAAITNYHKLGGLKHHAILKTGGPKSSCWCSCTLHRGLGKKNGSFLYSASGWLLVFLTIGIIVLCCAPSSLCLLYFLLFVCVCVCVCVCVSLMRYLSLDLGSSRIIFSSPNPLSEKTLFHKALFPSSRN